VVLTEEDCNYLRSKVYGPDPDPLRYEGIPVLDKLAAAPTTDQAVERIEQAVDSAWRYEDEPDEDFRRQVALDALAALSPTEGGEDA
jgi:hypothetical protein